MNKNKLRETKKVEHASDQNVSSYMDAVENEEKVTALVGAHHPKRLATRPRDCTDEDTEDEKKRGRQGAKRKKTKQKNEKEKTKEKKMKKEKKKKKKKKQAESSSEEEDIETIEFDDSLLASVALALDWKKAQFVMTCPPLTLQTKTRCLTSQT